MNRGSWKTMLDLILSLFKQSVQLEEAVGKPENILG